MAWKFADDRSTCHDSWRFILGIAAEVSSTIGGWHLGHIPEEWLPIWCQVHSAFFRIAADLAGCAMVTRDVMQNLEGSWCKKKEILLRYFDVLSWPCPTFATSCISSFVGPAPCRRRLNEARTRGGLLEGGWFRILDSWWRWDAPSWTPHGTTQ